jgi:hypothetical protein
LEELWISYNNIEKLKGINVLKKLKVNIQILFGYNFFDFLSFLGFIHIKQCSERVGRVPKIGL